MKIKVLGSGSSGNSYLVSDGTTNILLDAGLPVKEINKLLKFKTASLDGVLVTHEHGDHAKGVKDLIKLGIDVYASKGTWKDLGLEDSNRMHEIASKKAFDIKSIRVLPFDVIHDVEEPLGFLVQSKETNERLLFFTDTKYMKYTFSNIDYFLAECNYDKETLKLNFKDKDLDKGYLARVPETHMSLETLLEFLKKCDLSKTKQIYLVHMSKNNANPMHCLNEVKALTGVEVYIAKKGESIYAQ